MKNTKRMKTQHFTTSLLTLALALPFGGMHAQETLSTDDITTILIQESTPAQSGGATPGVDSGVTLQFYDGSQAVQDSSIITADTKDKSKKSSEKFCRHEFNFWGGFGFSTLLYNPEFGDRKNGTGWSAGVGYQYYFAPQWGVMVGAELMTYNAKIEVSQFTDTYDTNDADGQAINFRTAIRDYEEKQHLMNLNIPVMFQFQTNGKHRFYAAAGFKFGLPLLSTYKTEGGSFTTSGYYYDWQQEFTQQGDLNYGTYHGTAKKEDLDIDFSYTGSIEAGIKWQLTPRFSLYTGAYADYTFNDVMKQHDDKFLDYSTDDVSSFKQNSVLTSEYIQHGNSADKFVDKVTPLGMGVKVRFGVNLCKGLERDKKEKEEKLSQKNGYAPYGYPMYGAGSPQESLPMDKATLKQLLREVKAEEDQMKDIIREVLNEERQRANQEYGTDVRDVIVMNIDGYEINESKLSPKLEAVLIQKMEQLRKYGNDAVIVCEGHTCDIGKADYNMMLGLERANVIRNYLIRNGFNPNNIIATSKGEDSPAVPNTSETNRKMNRRVVFIVR